MPQDKRVIATEDNVERLFSRVTVPYPVPTDDGIVKVDMPAWQCKACGWESLMFMKGLPLQHCCDDVRAINGVWNSAPSPDIKY